MAYAVRLEQFEGPLELLLQLIEKEKLDVTRVSLASVADQFLKYIASQGDIPLSHLSSFLSVASRLILLKSRALLPLLEFTEEEESIEDLEWQLREYARFRDASVALGLLFHKNRQSHARDSFLGAEVVFYPPESLTGKTLADSFQSVLGEIPLREKLEEETLREVVSLEEKMLELRSTLSSRMEMSFRQLIAQGEGKLEVIVAFLAVLELVKQRFVRADQTEAFHDIALFQEG